MGFQNSAKQIKAITVIKSTCINHALIPNARLIQTQF